MRAGWLPAAVRRGRLAWVINPLKDLEKHRHVVSA
jgi:hypothetical protein